MSEKMEIGVGDEVAIVRVSDGAVLATAKVDLLPVNGREVRTETPFDQRKTSEVLLWRRYWSIEAPHKERQIPRDEKATRPKCVIRLATDEDRKEAQRRVAVRRAREDLPRAQRNLDEATRTLRVAEESLRQAQGMYDTRVKTVADAEALIATSDAMGRGP